MVVLVRCASPFGRFQTGRSEVDPLDVADQTGVVGVIRG